jgi:hypothetical protein
MVEFRGTDEGKKRNAGERVCRCESVDFHVHWTPIDSANKLLETKALLGIVWYPS